MLTSAKPRPSRLVTSALHRAGCCLLTALLLASPAAQAVEVLTAKELSLHCALLESEPEGVDGQYCIRYIQGFIDGAVATDARVMLNTESGGGTESFTERAMRTRAPSSADRFRAARLAGFCVGDPLPLREVVQVVVADLAKMPASTGSNPAMELVYASLMEHFPCKS